MDFVDANGKPRSREEYEAALRFVEAEIVVNPMRMGANGTGPALMHLITIREVLKALLSSKS